MRFALAVLTGGLFVTLCAAAVLEREYKVFPFFRLNLMFFL